MLVTTVIIMGTLMAFNSLNEPVYVRDTDVKSQISRSLQVRIRDTNVTGNSDAENFEIKQFLADCHPLLRTLLEKEMRQGYEIRMYPGLKSKPIGLEYDYEKYYGMYTERHSVRSTIRYEWRAIEGYSTFCAPYGAKASGYYTVSQHFVRDYFIHTGFSTKTIRVTDSLLGGDILPDRYEFDSGDVEANESPMVYFVSLYASEYGVDNVSGNWLLGTPETMANEINKGLGWSADNATGGIIHGYIVMIHKKSRKTENAFVKADHAASVRFRN